MCLPPSTSSVRKVDELAPPPIDFIPIDRVPPALAEHAAGEEWLVFPSIRGEVWEHGNIRTKLREIQQRAGVVGNDGWAKYGAHKFRHFFASMLIEGGIPIKRLQEILGHATAAMTLDVFGHLMPDRQGDHDRIAAVSISIAPSYLQQKTAVLQPTPSKTLKVVDESSATMPSRTCE